MKTILAAIDFSSITDAVLDAAARTARAFAANVCLAHVTPPDQGESEAPSC